MITGDTEPVDDKDGEELGGETGKLDDTALFPFFVVGSYRCES